MRTNDGGSTWVDASPTGMGTEELQFRDIQGFDAMTSVALSIGPGGDSRILRTSNGGATWTEVFSNTEELGFFDCMAFTSRQRGIAISDPVDRKILMQVTADGGRTWTRVNPAGIPAAADGEYMFAARGSCVAGSVGQNLWSTTGGVDPSRVLHSSDGGRTWSVATTPLVGGEAAGGFSISFRGARNGVIVGGDYLVPDGAVDNAAWTADGGRTGHKASTNPVGYRSGSSWLARGNSTVIAVGPSGSDVSVDGGRNWASFETGRFDAVECTKDGACWASGEMGRVATLSR